MPMNAGTFIMIILYINYFDMSGYTVYESLHDKSEPGLSIDNIIDVGSLYYLWAEWRLSSLPS